MLLKYAGHRRVALHRMWSVKTRQHILFTLTDKININFKSTK